MAIYWLVLLFCAISFGIEAVAVANTFWFLSYFPRLTRLFLNSIDCSRKAYMGVLFRPGIIAIVSALGHRLLIEATGLSGMAEIVLLAVELMLVWGLTVVIDKRKIIEDTRYLRTIMVAYGR
jgi:hypothetical protein